MSSNRILHRNRANATKSTGPRTSEGKAAVAGNARKHGLTARADPQNVAAWLAIIRDKPDILPQDLGPEDDFSYRALALAEAEVRLAVAEQALLDFEIADREFDQSLKSATANAFQIVGNALIARSASIEVRSALYYLRDMAERAKEQRKRSRLLKRYHSEAKSLRRKAFAAWLEITQRGLEIA